MSVGEITPGQFLLQIQQIKKSAPLVAIAVCFIELVEQHIKDIF